MYTNFQILDKTTKADQQNNTTQVDKLIDALDALPVNIDRKIAMTRKAEKLGFIQSYSACLSF